MKNIEKLNGSIVIFKTSKKACFVYFRKKLFLCIVCEKQKGVLSSKNIDKPFIPLPKKIGKNLVDPPQDFLIVCIYETMNETVWVQIPYFRLNQKKYST